MVMTHKTADLSCLRALDVWWNCISDESLSYRPLGQRDSSYIRPWEHNLFVLSTKVCHILFSITVPLVSVLISKKFYQMLHYKCVVCSMRFTRWANIFK